MSEIRIYQDQPFHAELYDFVPAYARRSDIGFYLDVCRQVKGGILEIGCGTGRILLPVARAGGHITGVDISSTALQRCEQKSAAETESVRKRIRLLPADMRRLSLDESFQLATMPFRVFQHLLTVDDQISCLRGVHYHLQKRGMLVFDVFHADFSRLASSRHGEEIEDTPLFRLPDGRKLRRTFRVSQHHRAEQYSDVELIFYLTDTSGAAQRLVQAFPFRYYFRYEIEHLLARSGFEMVALYGDFDKSPLVDSSPEMIFVAARK